LCLTFLRPSVVRSGCKGTTLSFEYANYFLKNFLLSIFKNALSLRDYKGKARILNPKLSSIKKAIFFLTRMQRTEDE
ncbi:MAG: hypothetical protein ACK417_12950, partial [Bacteroidia bacterium]